VIFAGIMDDVSVLNDVKIADIENSSDEHLDKSNEITFNFVFENPNDIIHNSAPCLLSCCQNFML